MDQTFYIDEVVLSELLKRMAPDERMVAFLMNLGDAGMKTEVVKNVVNNSQFWIQQIQRLGYVVKEPKGSAKTWKRLYFFFSRPIPKEKLLEEASGWPFDSKAIEILLDSQTQRYKILDKILYDAIKGSSECTQHHKINRRIVEKILTDNYRSNRFRDKESDRSHGISGSFGRSEISGGTYSQQALEEAAHNGYGWIVERLLKDPYTQPGGTEIIEAARQGHLSTVKILLKDPRIGDEYKTRALVEARRNKHHDIENVIMEALRM